MSRSTLVAWLIFAAGVALTATVGVYVVAVIVTVGAGTSPVVETVGWCVVAVTVTVGAVIAAVAMIVGVYETAVIGSVCGCGLPPDAMSGVSGVAVMLTTPAWTVPVAVIVG